MLGGRRGDGVGPVQEVSRDEGVGHAHRGSQRTLRARQAVQLEDPGANRGGGNGAATNSTTATTNAAAATENAFDKTQRKIGLKWT